MRAAWASAGVVAEVRSWTFSLTVRERSPSDYTCLACAYRVAVEKQTSLIFAG